MAAAADAPILVLPGGSGFLGRHVARSFATFGWRVRILSRRPTASNGTIETFVWDARTLGPWTAALDGAAAVLNLTGRSVNCRYNARNREQILRSRVDSTAILAQAMQQVDRPPRVWLNSSTATIYRHAQDRPQDEFTGEIGSGFSIDVARAWEASFFEPALPPGIRRAALRTAMVMGRGAGGPFDVFYRLVRLRLGGRMGNGQQRVSWLHVADFVRAVRFLMERDDLGGIVNVVAPNIPTNDQFMQTLREAAGLRVGLPATRWMLEVGAVLLRTETELPLKSRWVAPARLIQSGFSFEFPDWSAAARDLVARSAD